MHVSPNFFFVCFTDLSYMFSFICIWKLFNVWDNLNKKQKLNIRDGLI